VDFLNLINTLYSMIRLCPSDEVIFKTSPMYYIIKVPLGMNSPAQRPHPFSLLCLLFLSNYKGKRQRSHVSGTFDFGIDLRMDSYQGRILWRSICLCIFHHSL
jgi:hypothetical protein